MANRSRRHFGSVRKRPSKRYGDQWEASYWHEGQRYVAENLLPTKDAAHAWLDAKNTEIRAGKWTDPGGRKMKFTEWAEYYKTTMVDLRRSTKDRDVGYIDRYIIPTFGEMELGKIDFMAVTAWVTVLLGPGPKPWWDTHKQPKRKRRALSAATATKAGQVMAKVMATAVRAGKLTANPCDGVKLPKVEHKETRFLTTAEVDRLADAINPAFRAVVYLGAFGGLRAAELFGLRRERLDLVHRRVDVAETMVEVSGHLVTGPPKTKSGRRMVPLPRTAVGALNQHLTSYPGRPSDLVFAAPHGGPVRLASWRTRTGTPPLKRPVWAISGSTTCATRPSPSGSPPGPVPRKCRCGPATPRSRSRSTAMAISTPAPRTS